MARQVLPVIGAVVGFVVGGPVGAQIGFTLGNIAGNAVDPQVIKGPRIGDTGFQGSNEGVPRAIVYGTAAVTGNVIDRGPLEKVIKRERQGKGGGPVVESERLYLTFAIRICEGPIDGIQRIWEDEKLVYDTRTESTIVEESAAFSEGFTLYLGGEDQLPDPDLETIHGVGNTPAYRGSAYIVFTRKDVTDRRGSIPQYRFEVCRNVGAVTSSSDGLVGKVDALLFTIDQSGEPLTTTFNVPIPASSQVGDAVYIYGMVAGQGFSSFEIVPAPRYPFSLGFYQSLSGYDPPDRGIGGASGNARVLDSTDVANGFVEVSENSAVTNRTHACVVIKIPAGDFHDITASDANRYTAFTTIAANNTTVSTPTSPSFPGGGSGRAHVFAVLRVTGGGMTISGYPFSLVRRFHAGVGTTGDNGFAQNVALCYKVETGSSFAGSAWGYSGQPTKGGTTYDLIAIRGGLTPSPPPLPGE